MITEPYGVLATADHQHVAWCNACGYRSKPMPSRHRANASLTGHRHTGGHRRRMRRHGSSRA